MFLDEHETIKPSLKALYDKSKISVKETASLCYCDL